MSTKDKINKCLKEGESGRERHKGLRKTQPSSETARGHLTKALHNFDGMQVFHDINYSDWSASAAFYTLYHGLLAILAQKGYESRNQSCTLAIIQNLIEKDEIKYLTIEDVKEIFDSNVDLAHSTKILDIRERMQYSLKTSLAEEEYQILRKRTKELLDKIRLEIERLIT